MLPDLDVLIDHSDAVLNMIRHRAESHSLIFLTLLAFPMAWAISRLHKEEHLRFRWILAIWLSLVTHPLLDLMTIYGTQALLPFTDEAWGLGSVFIIDPAYMFPLYGGLLLTFFCREKRVDRGMNLNRLGLLVSTVYLAWSVMAQNWVLQHARMSLRAQGLPMHSLLATPSPFNTVLWRVVALDGELFLRGFTRFLMESVMYASNTTYGMRT